jgi:hypothetical protein
VTIAELKYTPDTLQVAEGDGVLWTFNGPDTNHSVTADDGSYDSDAGKDASQVSHPAGDGFSHLFAKAGTYGYHCKVHPFMKGTIAVGPAPEPSPAAAAPRLTGVSASPRRVRARRATTTTTVRYTLDSAAAMHAALRRRSGSRPVGKVLRRVDWSSPPGPGKRPIGLGRLRPGPYVLTVVATDNVSGRSSRAAGLRIEARP